MILLDATRQHVLLRYHVYHIAKMRYELFDKRLEYLQQQFIPIVESFDLLGRELTCEFEVLWREATELIYADSKFVLFSSNQMCEKLDRDWSAWLEQLTLRIDAIREFDRQGNDAGVQIEMLQEFIAEQSRQRAYIMRLSRRLLDRLFVDAPHRLAKGDVGGACRVSANALNTVGSAINSPLSTLAPLQR